ncbi:TolC family protein [Herbaspirillum rubrisubalbicans]|uniref:Protein CyaE n=1 Tax=Herbaspirillum rubrisubalbicans TaxID=80842 RepID=A0ABX9C3F1_9BURK|nr:TolC family protein [Herbaspirillum rubrisubalbicans]RAM64976.1 histidine kinase [Herbaspirillum rubrisubalbicans]
MNVDAVARRLLAAVALSTPGWLAVLVATMPAPAHSAEPQHFDPLLARPPELDKGKLLPGDDQMLVCQSTSFRPDKVLNLADALDLALCYQPQIQASWAAIKLQAAQLGEARAAYLPSLSAGASQYRDHSSSTQGSSKRSIGTLYATLTWRLLDFGGRTANQRAADVLLQAALASQDATLQKAMANAVGLYYDAHSARAAQQARERSLALARQVLETAIKREQRGVGALPETLQARTFVARAELELARAIGQHKRALVALAVGLGLLGESEDVPTLTLSSEIEEDPLGLEQNLPAWLQSARQYHPAILAARAQVEAAREKVKVARSEGLPTLDMSASRFVNGRPNQSGGNRGDRETVVGLNLNIPVFEGFARNYKVDGAHAQVEQREAELRDVQAQVLGDLAITYAEATTALRSLASSRSLLEVAQRAVDSVRRKYDAGAADIVEMLNAQSALSGAELERIRSLSDWRSARLRLLANAGEMGRASLVTTARR